MKLCKLKPCDYAVIIGEKYKKALEPGLERLGAFVLWLPDNPLVDPRLSGHADLSAVLVPGRGLVLAPYLKETEFPHAVDKLGFDYSFANIEQGMKYPQDAYLNVCCVGEYMIANPKTAYNAILGKKTIAVKQGYSRCSVCVVSDDAVITADRGIAEAVKDKLDVLLVSPGYVSLAGFECGFLGGAAFKSDGKLCFSGRPDAHPDKDRIIAFLAKHHVSPVYLTDGALFDFGGAVVLS